MAYHNTHVYAAFIQPIRLLFHFWKRNKYPIVRGYTQVPTPILRLDD